MPEQSDARLVLMPAQQALYEALMGRRADLAQWYRAAVTVVNAACPIASPSLRTLCEK